jgi:anti-sigma regulatory factor (Ser/Thr protein kinase)
MMRSIAVQEESQIAEARREAVARAHDLGFGEEDSGRVAIVATELATNLLKHGKGGELLVSAFEDTTGDGVECLALDRGPGIANVDLSLRDGHSTAGSAGTGLGAIVRGAHLFDIYARLGTGTAILARLKKGRPPKARPPIGEARWGGINLPKRGEDACGDAWSVKAHARGYSLMVADGLGHGPFAAEASHAAVKAFHAEQTLSPGVTLERVHAALRKTRGAAVAIASLDLHSDAVIFAGIGNIAGVLITNLGARQMVSHNGTAGHVAKRMQEFTYPFKGVPLVILCSDGLGTRWSLDAYPALTLRHPTLIAGVLYRDFQRGRDDVTVIVARGIT